MRRKKHPFVLTFLAINLLTSVSYAQRSNDASVKAAAKSFYRVHLVHFGYPLEPDLKRLRPYISPELNSLLANEVRRMRDWSAKNPDQKPSIMEDLFVCNRYEPPRNFRIIKARYMGQKAIVTVKFNYVWKSIVIDSCEVEATFIRVRGKWLLENVDWDETPDLRTLLSRKDYAVVPK